MSAAPLPPQHPSAGLQAHPDHTQPRLPLPPAPWQSRGSRGQRRTRPPCSKGQGPSSPAPCPAPRGTRSPARAREVAKNGKISLSSNEVPSKRGKEKPRHTAPACPTRGGISHSTRHRARGVTTPRAAARPPRAASSGRGAGRRVQPLGAAALAGPQGSRAWKIPALCSCRCLCQRAQSCLPPPGDLTPPGTGSPGTSRSAARGFAGEAPRCEEGSLRACVPAALLEAPPVLREGSRLPARRAPHLIRSPAERSAS